MMLQGTIISDVISMSGFISSFHVFQPILMLEDSLVTGKSPRIQADDHHTLSHTSTADHGDQARFAGKRSEGIVHYTTWTFLLVEYHCFVYATFSLSRLIAIRLKSRS